MRIPKKPKHRKRLPFYWWRRYPVHKSLRPTAPLLEKIQNGDFDYPQFFKEAKYEMHWLKQDQEEYKKNYIGFEDPESSSGYIELTKMAYKRRNLLIEDGDKADRERLDQLVNRLSKQFKVPKDKIWEEMEEFGGNIEKFYYYIKNKYL
tara:strand:- start:169 stop:615 length:447 start_codon:yes stop_codon:yes gene_type:complete